MKALKPSPMPSQATMRAEDLEKVFREHYAMVFRTAYRVAGNATDAEDVLQTVFLRLWRRAADAEPVDHLPSYLHRAAVNAALDLIRSRQNVRSVPLDDLEPVLAEPAYRNPDRQQTSSETRRWLSSVLARLNPRIAEMFVLRFFEGKDNPEIARLMGTTPATVAVTISRTRDRLQKEYRSFLGGVA
jgi:RNA polymerase sigma-70 factor (ECF subfamily)